MWVASNQPDEEGVTLSGRLRLVQLSVRFEPAIPPITREGPEGCSGLIIAFAVCPLVSPDLSAESLLFPTQRSLFPRRFAVTCVTTPVGLSRIDRHPGNGIPFHG